MKNLIFILAFFFSFLNVNAQKEKLDQLLTRLLEDLSVKAASQLAADLTGIKKKIAYQRALELMQDQAE